MPYIDSLRTSTTVNVSPEMLTLPLSSTRLVSPGKALQQEADNYLKISILLLENPIRLYHHLADSKRPSLEAKLTEQRNIQRNLVAQDQKNKEQAAKNILEIARLEQILQQKNIDLDNLKANKPKKIKEHGINDRIREHADEVAALCAQIDSINRGIEELKKYQLPNLELEQAKVRTTIASLEAKTLENPSVTFGLSDEMRLAHACFYALRGIIELAKYAKTIKNEAAKVKCFSNIIQAMLFLNDRIAVISPDDFEQIIKNIRATTDTQDSNYAGIITQCIGEISRDRPSVELFPSFIALFQARSLYNKDDMVKLKTVLAKDLTLTQSIKWLRLAILLMYCAGTIVGGYAILRFLLSCSPDDTQAEDTNNNNNNSGTVLFASVGIGMFFSFCGLRIKSTASQFFSSSAEVRERKRELSSISRLTDCSS